MPSRNISWKALQEDEESSLQEVEGWAGTVHDVVLAHWLSTHQSKIASTVCAIMPGMDRKVNDEPRFRHLSWHYLPERCVRADQALPLSQSLAKPL